MGSVGDAYDNAMCESFFATLECELLDRCRFKTQAEARIAVFAFIEGFYNPRRRHSSIGYLSPIDYERRHQAAAVDPDAFSLPPCSRPSRTSPPGGRRTRPSLTAAARGSRVTARVGTEELLRWGSNQRMPTNRRTACRQISYPEPKLSPLHRTGAGPEQPPRVMPYGDRPHQQVWIWASGKTALIAAARAILSASTTSRRRKTPPNCAAVLAALERQLKRGEGSGGQYRLSPVPQDRG